MERSTKQTVVAELANFLSKASSCVVMDYGSVNMETFTPLRKECAQNNVKLVVVKNALAKIALKDTPYEGIESLLKGMSALILTMEKDQVAGAKIAKKFSKVNEKFRVKGGMIDGSLLNVDQVIALAELPSKEEMQARLLATMLAVPQNFVRLLAAVPQSFLQLLNAYKGKKESEG